jgi:hypothetical protein
MYNVWKPENTLNWWGNFGAENPFVFGTERVNALSKNHYTSVLPGYLSTKLVYTKLSRIIPCPNAGLREQTKNEMYCVYVAFECKVPSNNDEQFDYVCPSEQVFCATTEKRRERKKIQEICTSVHTLNEERLFDTGATVHVTPNRQLLFNTSICCSEIKVANGRHVQARQVGDIFLKCECGNFLYIYKVFYFPQCLTRISSVHPSSCEVKTTRLL